MHYEIDYSSKTVEDAINDCKEWLGTKQFNRVVTILKMDCGRTSKHLVRLGLAMQGIQGYPAEAMINKYWNPQQELDLSTDEQFHECGWQLGSRTI